MIRFLLLLVAGVAAYVVAFPPMDWGWAGVVSLTAFGLAFLEPPMGWLRWLAVYLSGVVLFYIGCAWLMDLSPLFPLFMAVFEGIALVLVCFLYRQAVLSSSVRIPVWLALPLAWVAVEYLRTIFPLDGFPWLLVGYTWWKYPPLIQFADITGVYGPGFLIAMAAGLLVTWIRFISNKTTSPKRKPLMVTILYGILILLVCIYGFIRPDRIELEDGPVLAAVQGNLEQELKDNVMRADEVFDRYLDTTRLLFKGPREVTPNLVIWPETLFPYPLVDSRHGDIWLPEQRRYSLQVEKAYISKKVMEETLAPYGAWFLTGLIGYSTDSEGELIRRNSAFFYDPSGERRATYHKTLLVPGGEYLPYIEYMPFKEKIKTIIREGAGFLPDLKPGFGPQVMHFDWNGRVCRFGVQICFENIYGDYCRQFIRDGAEFLINISNEGWFRSPSEFDQMLAMSVFRAVETRKTLFRSTNTGISCIIGPRGGIPGENDRIMQNGRDRSVKGVLIKKVMLNKGGSIYTQVGDLFAQTVFCMQIILMVFLLFKNRWGKKEVSFSN